MEKYPKPDWGLISALLCPKVFRGTLFMLVSPSPSPKTTLPEAGLLSQHVTKSKDSAVKTKGTIQDVKEVMTNISHTLEAKLTPGNKNIPSNKNIQKKRLCQSPVIPKPLPGHCTVFKQISTEMNSLQNRQNTEQLWSLFYLASENSELGAEKRTVNQFSGWEKLLVHPSPHSASQMSGKCSSVAENVALFPLLFNSLRSSPQKKCALFAF